MSNDPRNSAAAPAKANLEAARSRVMLRLAVAALLAAFALFALPATVEARSLALVIGQDAYVNVPALRTAVGDARAVGDQLEKMGFIVRRALNVDQRAMSRALVAFEGELQPGDRALFFYAGHGFEISGANYLLPTDVPTAQANRIGIVRDAAFSVESIIDGIRESGARLTVLVLDACRDNPFAPSGRAGAKTKELQAADAKAREASDQLAAVQSQVQAASSDRDQLVAAAAAAKNQLADLQQQADSVGKNLADLQRQADAAAKTLADLQQQGADAAKTLADLQAKIQAAPSAADPSKPQ
jgi:Caspase domain